VGPGDTVEKSQAIALIRDVFGDKRVELRSPAAGLVIGSTRHPLVNQGDAVVHLAREVERVVPP
jgi:predicted deacylase